MVYRVIFVSNPTLVQLWLSWSFDNKQAGAELGQAQDKLKVKVDAGVEVQVKVGAEVEV